MLIIGFSKTNSLISRAIRWITKSQVSHVYLIVEFLGRPVVIHADWSGVVIVDYDQFCSTQTVVSEFVLDIDATNELDELVLEFGKGYDFGGLFGHLFVQLGRLFGRKWSNQLQSESRWFCSELIAYLLDKEDVCNFDGAPYSSITPDDLLNFFSKDTIVPLIEVESIEDSNVQKGVN